MTLLRRRPRPLPPSVRVHPDVPWVDPNEVAPPWWHRALSVAGLACMILALGVALAISIGILLLGGFLLLDFLIS